MNIDEKYMYRCLQLASLGKGRVSPNPMVGAVIVHNGKIVGEGFHRKYGQPHAEVNAVNSVKDKSMLRESTMYVSLEPCSHYGKTPPCAKLIIDMQIPKVVIAVTDPFPQVAGGGIKMLKESGVEVMTGVLEKEAKELNKDFFSRQLRQRPYVYLKWAQSKDGFIDKIRKDGEAKAPTPISNSFTKMLVHKKRSEIAAIMIGTNTALNDNPSLTTRLWYGKNPIRVVLDRKLKIPQNYYIYDDSVQTIIFTEKVEKSTQKGNNTILHPLVFDEGLLSTLLAALNNYKIDSVLVEGGRQVLESFIKSQLWDEAFIEIAEFDFKQGVSAPHIKGEIVLDAAQYGARMLYLKNPENHKFL